MAKAPEWQQFEKDVASFIAAIDPNAKVNWNYKTPDTDTGKLRQRDVWVEASLAQHFPVKMLVSCKFKTRKLSQQDIDDFVGELNSSGAQKGAIFSRAGFTDAAITKARKRGICCCRLFKNQPPDLPDILIFHSYLCLPHIKAKLAQGCPAADWSLKIWKDLLDVSVDNIEGKETVLDAMAAIAYHTQTHAIEKRTPGLPPTGIGEFKISEADRTPITIQVECSWLVYQGKLEAHLLDGSYSVTSEDFKGMQFGPVISLAPGGPGPGWELLDGTPTVEPQSIIAVLGHGEDALRHAIVTHLGPQPFQ